MSKFHIANAHIINEGANNVGEIFIANGIIEKINFNKNSNTPASYLRIDAKGKYLLPGVIDDQVHFRQPGLETKADIYTESRAAVAGGVTSFMDMPNTMPPTLTQDLLEDKYNIASANSIANFSFFMGVSNDNIDEVLKTPLDSVCGVKIFLGASTGNLLVDNYNTIEKLFSTTPHIIAAHCEDEEIIRQNINVYKNKFDENVMPAMHPMIRSDEACFKSTSMAVDLAKKKNTRLHVFHLSTAKELSLFDNDIPLENKKITAEVCVHHLWFCDDDYEKKGNLIKWNPAIKTKNDRDALRAALKSGLIDVVATDHAPHLLKEKLQMYFKAPSGGPMVQHSLQAMIALANTGLWSVEDVARFMCHRPATLFRIAKRGFIREGYFADLVLVDMQNPYRVNMSNILYKCAWSPLEDEVFSASIDKTFVNGNLVWDGKNILEVSNGTRLYFERK